MHLKKLELSGFKSFAKTTVLEFPLRVTGIVGPNGSGKSNITEAIRWVLGEQSMKSLRGKKGEDLIWNGSPHTPRMGKAAVILVFDNADGKIPLEFQEIAVARKIFRDGMNEYYINDSQVRLKDVVEFMARVGLGETKHNIIGQGEVDRMLLSTSRDRREMLEDALGLRIYQLKKHETERKLEATEQNVKQVEGIIRELTPHLKFLRLQAEKSRARSDTEQELRNYEIIYFLREKKEIEEERRKLVSASGPLRERMHGIQQDIARVTQELEEADSSFFRVEINKEREEKMAALDVRRGEMERELGRLEGRLGALHESNISQSKETKNKLVVAPEAVQELVDSVREFIADARTLLEEEESMEVMQSHLRVLMEDIERLIEVVDAEKNRENTVVHDSNSKLVQECEDSIRRVQGELSGIAKELEIFQRDTREERMRTREIQNKVRATDQMLRAKQDEERDLSLLLERFKFDEERMVLREKTYAEEYAVVRITEDDYGRVDIDLHHNQTLSDVHKKIERMRIKLEEIGSIDPAIIREFEETDERCKFLAKELEDLRNASVSLTSLVSGLDLHIKRDFREGFAKIKEEFNNYFKVIFGGGKAVLKLVEEKNSGIEEGDFLEDLKEKNEGIDIAVDLPRKRIMSLAMLSGGERALTAIALLFAITAVNPPPFLILDETDAALDEANSQRYSAILKELSQKTQLLLVTHNRETMKSANILYGVTMGGDGVSKILSLKFEEAETYTNR